MTDFNRAREDVLLIFYEAACAVCTIQLQPLNQTYTVHLV